MSAAGEKGYCWVTRAGNVWIFQFYSLTAIDIDPFMETEIGLFLQVFVRKVIELHDKYLAYVNDCFQNHTLFHKVMIV
jgi:hypothetical protein